jgi:flagellar biosynthetic protein FlhB
MAEDKHQRTEKPTPKRRHDARQKGQTARSADISAWATVLIGSFILPSYISHATTVVSGVVSQAIKVMSNPTTSAALSLMGSGLGVAVKTVLPLAAAIAVFGMISSVAQTGFGLSLHSLMPQFSRVSPKGGIKRLFGLGTLEQLGRQLAKLTVLIGVAYGSLNTIIKVASSKTPVSLAPLLTATAGTILAYVRTVALLGLGIGVADFIYQKRHLLKMLKMTKHEVREEMRSQEGNPAIKGEIRKRQYAIARSHMLKAVRSADLIITNPTHYVVALKYQVGSRGAPVVVAKGADDFARRLREEAEQYGVPRVEDPPLARWMYSFCDVDQPIPAEIYIAVAKVLAFVYSLPAQLRMRTLRPTPSQVPVDPGQESGVMFARRYRREEAERALQDNLA